MFAYLFFLTFFGLFRPFLYEYDWREVIGKYACNSVTLSLLLFLLSLLIFIFFLPDGCVKGLHGIQFPGGDISIRNSGVTVGISATEYRLIVYGRAVWFESRSYFVWGERRDACP